MSDLDLSRIKAAQRIYDGKLPAEFEVGQKLIAADANLLWEGFDYSGNKLDLYGEIDSNGDYFVDEVAFAHTRLSLLNFITIRQLEYFTGQCNAELARKKERKQNDRADAYAMKHG